MTLLGVPQFSLGTANAGAAAQPTMNMSLDDMIRERRKAQGKESTRPRRVSTRERQAGASRAKRQANLNARRGISTTNKPTAKEIQKEVKMEVEKSDQRRQRQDKSRLTKTQATRLQTATGTSRNNRRETAKSNLATATNNKTVPKPSKKQVMAAKSALKETGFQVPRGMQMNISFVPTNNKTPVKNNQGNKNTNTNKPAGRGGGRGRVSGGGGRVSGGGGRGSGGKGRGVGGSGGGRKNNN